MNICQYIIKELKNYKHNKALLEIIKNEPTGLQASVVTGMPTAHSRNSTTEQNAICNRDVEKITREIKTVDIWLGLLEAKELFVVTNVLINNSSYEDTVKKYYKEFGIIFSERYWKYRRQQGIERVAKLYIV